MAAAQQLPLRLLLASMLGFFLSSWHVLATDSMADVSGSRAPGLSHSSILLPLHEDGDASSVRLHAYNGCFTWTSKNPKLLRLEPLYDSTGKCSVGASLKSIQSYEGRRSTFVFARDEVTGASLRCDVFFDRIHRLHAVQNTHELFLESLAEVQMHAYDVEGNKFSSLNGLHFKWEAHNKNASSSTLRSVLGFQPSVVLTPDQHDESQLIVKGVAVGNVEITGSCLSCATKGLKATIPLLVVELISILPTPPPIKMLSGNPVQLLIEVTVATGDTKILPVPSPHYSWSSADTNVVKVDSATGLTTSVRTGFAEITLKDERVDSDRESTLVEVVDPSDLQMTVQWINPQTKPDQEAEKWYMFSRPTDSIYLVVGRSYHLQPSVTDASGDSLRLTNETSINVLSPKSEVWTKKRLVMTDVKTKGNAGICRVDMHKEGSVSVQIGVVWHARAHEKAELQSHALTTHRQVHSCPPMQPKLVDSGNVVRLPWVPGIAQTFSPNVSGGCDSGNSLRVLWKHSEVTSATVNGQGMITARGLGRGVVHALASNDLFYGHNAVELPVVVSYPTSVAKDQSFALEIPLHSEASLLLSYLTPEGKRFHNCSELQRAVTWTVTGVGAEGEPLLGLTTVAVPADLQLKGVCAAAVVKALRGGSARVDAGIPTSSGHHLVASWSLAAYLPLCVEPTDLVREPGKACAVDWEEQGADILLPLGQAYVVNLRGGPGHMLEAGGLATVKNAADKVTVRSSEGLDVTNTDVRVRVDAKHRIYDIVCMQVGNFTLLVEVTGTPAKGGSQRVQAEIGVRLSCDFPSRLVLLQGHLAAQGMHTPLELAAASMVVADMGGAISGVPITVMNSAPYLLRAVVLDSNSRPFANASMFQYEWTVEHPGVALSLDPHSKDYAMLSLNEEIGLIKVFVKIAGITLHDRTPAATARAVKSAVAQRLSALSDGCVLEVVAPLRTLPSEVALCLGHKAGVKLPILGGSRHIHAEVNDTAVVKAGVHGHALELVPMGRGATTVLLKDQITRLEAVVSVEVVTMASVRVLLPRGECRLEEVVQAVVEVRSQEGFVITPLQYQDLQIKVLLHDTRLAVAGLNISSETALLNLKCEAPGLAFFHLTVNGFDAGAPVRSNVLRLHVFEPVKISPEMEHGGSAPILTMFVGTVRTLAVSGGGGAVEKLVFVWTTMDPGVVTVKEDMPCLTAVAPGKTSVRAEAVGADGQVYGRDDILVEVIGLPDAGGMVLAVQKYIALGQEMSATIQPASTLKGMDTGTMAQICHSYKWLVDVPTVLGVGATQGQHFVNPKLNMPVCGQAMNINPGFTTRLVGRKVGIATIKVTMNCGDPGTRSMKKYHLSQKIQVVDTIPTLIGSVCPTWLLPTNYTSVPVLPIDNEAAMYRIMQDPTAMEPVVMVDEHGQIITGALEDVACIRAAPRPGTLAHPGPPAVTTCVRVAEVAQLTVGGPNIPPHVQEVSVGATARFQVVMRDATAMPMKVGPSEHGAWLVESSDPAVIDAELEGDTLAVRSVVEGSAVVRLTKKGSAKVTAYVVVQSGDYIKPRAPTVYLGAVLHFTVSGAYGQDLGKGTWHSGNNAVIRVDPETGVAAAVGEGFTTLHFNGSKLATYTPVTVTRVMSVGVSRPPGESFLTNAPVGWDYVPGKTAPAVRYSFAVTFGDANAQPLLPAATSSKAPPPKGIPKGLETSSSHQHIQFECRVIPASLAHARPTSDPTSGLAACELEMHGPESGAAGSHEVSMVEVVASIPGASEDGSSIEGRTAMPFIGGFSLAKGTPKTIQLSPRQNSTMIEILGNAAGVEALWSRRDVMTVDITSIHSTRDGISRWLQSSLYGRRGNSAVGAMFIVGVAREAYSFVDTIVLTIPQTNQRIELQVSYVAGVTLLPSIVISQTAVTTLLVLAIGAVVYVIYTRGESSMPAKLQYSQVPSQSGGYYSSVSRSSQSVQRRAVSVHHQEQEYH